MAGTRPGSHVPPCIGRRWDHGFARVITLTVSLVMPA